MDKINTYTKKERNMYLTGMLGQNMVYNIIGTGLAFYLQSVIFVPAMAISIIMAVARVWDAINDPMMGSICDKTKTKWGKCRPYLLFCPPVICICTIICFINGRYSIDNSMGKNILIIAWAAISYILWGMAYTVADIPLWGISSLMTEDQNDRSKILALARITGGIGAGIVMLAIVQISQSVGTSLESKVGDKAAAQQYGFIIVAVVLTLVGGALFQLAGIFTKERVSQSNESYNMKENFKLMWNNVPFRKIIISCVIRSPIMLLMTVAITLLNYYFGNYGMKDYTLYLIVLGGAIFIAQFGMSAITPKLCEKFDKTKTYNLCTVISAICFALIFVVYLIAPKDLDKPLWIVVNFFLFAGAGAGIGALNVLQSIFIADAVDYEEYYHGIRPDGVFFSGQSFATKLSSGIASIIQGIAFSIIGFSGSNVEKCNAVLQAGGSFKDEFPQYAGVMFFLCAIPPAIGLILSIIPMRNYPLNKDEHNRILVELIERRHSDNTESEANNE